MRRATAALLAVLAAIEPAAARVPRLSSPFSASSAAQRPLAAALPGSMSGAGGLAAPSALAAPQAWNGGFFAAGALSPASAVFQAPAAAAPGEERPFATPVSGEAPEAGARPAPAPSFVSASESESRAMTLASELRRRLGRGSEPQAAESAEAPAGAASSAVAAPLSPRDSLSRSASVGGRVLARAAVRDLRALRDHPRTRAAAKGLVIGALLAGSAVLLLLLTGQLGPALELARSALGSVAAAGASSWSWFRALPLGVKLAAAVPPAAAALVWAWKRPFLRKTIKLAAAAAAVGALVYAGLWAAGGLWALDWVAERMSSEFYLSNRDAIRGQFSALGWAGWLLAAAPIVAVIAFPVLPNEFALLFLNVAYPFLGALAIAMPATLLASLLTFVAGRLLLDWWWGKGWADRLIRENVERAEAKRKARGLESESLAELLWKGLERGLNSPRRIAGLTFWLYAIPFVPGKDFLGFILGSLGKISLKRFLVVSTLGRLPGTAFGVGQLEIIEWLAAGSFPAHLAALAAGAILALLALWHYWRRAARRVSLKSAALGLVGAAPSK